MAMCDEARALLAGLGAVDLTNLTAASVYADTADSEARHARQAGRLDDADRLEREVYDIAEKVLARRPGDLRSMKNRALAANLLGEIASTRHDDAAAAQYAERAALAGEDVVRFNPSDLGTWQYWIMGRGQVAERLFERGEIERGHRCGARDACAWRRRATAVHAATAAGGDMVPARVARGGVRSQRRCANARLPAASRPPKSRRSSSRKATPCAC